MTARVGRTDLRRAALPGVVAVVAVVDALLLLRHQPLSWDEAVTVAEATRPVRDLGRTVAHTDAVLGLYYLLVHGWALLLHGLDIRPTEAWWRLPGTAAAVGTCVLAAVLARRLAGPVAAFLAGSLLAVMPLFAFHAVDARPYPLAALAATAAWTVATGPRGVPGRSLRRATVVVVLLVLAAWLQLITVLVWPAFLVAGGRAGLRRTGAVLVAAGLGTLPLVVVALRQGGELGWVPTATVAGVLGVALHVGGGVAVVSAGVLLGGLALRAGLVRATPMTVAVLWWCVGPVAVLAALDVVRPVLVARYALVSVPLAAVAVAVVVVRAGRRVAAGADGRRYRVVQALGAATALACVVTTLVQGVAPYKYEDYRAGARYAVGIVPAGTAVLYAPSTARLGLAAYVGLGRWRDVASPGGVGPDPLRIPVLPAASLAPGLARTCRVLVVGDPVHDATPTPPDRATLHLVAGWPVTAARRFGQVTVSVVTNPRCGSGPASTPTTRAVHVRT